jgi:hypothetical protein
MLHLRIEGEAIIHVQVAEKNRAVKRSQSRKVRSFSLRTTSLFGWLVADGWCWFVLREEYCWLVAVGWFVLREKYCWLVADKPSGSLLGSPSHCGADDAIPRHISTALASLHL